MMEARFIVSNLSRKMAMARSQAGMPLTGVVGGDGNNVDGNNSGGAGGGGGQ